MQLREPLARLALLRQGLCQESPLRIRRLLARQLLLSKRVLRLPEMLRLSPGRLDLRRSGKRQADVERGPRG